MDPLPLPLAPGCALDETGLREQLERYRAVGRGASLLTRGASELTLELAPAVSQQAVLELIAVERTCCPFFTLDFSPSSRRLTVAVPAGEHEQELAAVCAALGLDEPAGAEHRVQR